MMRHHEQAVEMSILERASGTTDGVLVFAQEIERSQSYEIGLMEATLERWGYQREDPPATAMAWMGMGDGRGIDPGAMPGMASEAEIDRLESSRGTQADALFIELMKDHHLGGAEMADAAADLASNDVVVELAERLARNQRAEIAELEAARVRYGLPELSV